MADIEIRRLRPEDSLAELTSLLHRAYGGLLAMGLNFTAATQDEAKTRERVEGNECFVAVEGSVIRGTVTLLPGWPADVPGAEPGVRSAFILQFGVEPALQRRGLGTRLMDHAEDRARALGYAAVGLDTAEPAEHLLRLYEGRGYRRRGFARWPGKTYRSVILARVLG